MNKALALLIALMLAGISSLAAVGPCAMAEQEDCCCAVVAPTAPDAGCCGETVPEPAVPADPCTCSIEPVDEDLPTRLIVPGPTLEKLQTPTYSLVPATEVFPARTAQVSFLSNDLSPPGRSVPLSTLHCSFLL